MGKFHTPQDHNIYDALRPLMDRRRLGDDNRPDCEQCCFCGEPATCWPTYGLPPKDGELALVEQQVYAMCGVCYEEAEEVRSKKSKQYERHVWVVGS